jgi:hypothetical protein
LVELLVTKIVFLPAARSMSSVSGTPSMSESPRQMTPSQSKMNASTWTRSARGAQGAWGTQHVL